MYSWCYVKFVNAINTVEIGRQSKMSLMENFCKWWNVNFGVLKVDPTGGQKHIKIIFGFTSYVTIVTHDTHKETDITIATKQFNCDQLFKEGRSADPCGVVVWWCRSGQGGRSTIALSQVTAQHHVSVAGAGAKMASWQLPPLTTGQEEGQKQTAWKHSQLCRNNLPKWMRKSAWPGQKYFDGFLIIYVWKWYGR